MTSERNKPNVGWSDAAAGISQGLAQQAAIQAKGRDRDFEEIEREYLNLNTGACATNPELCAEHPNPTTGEPQERARKTRDTYTDTIRRWSAALRGYHAEDLTNQVRHFARQHPGLVIGGALVAGFALTRAVKITGNNLKDWRSPGRQPSFEPTPGQDFLPGEEEVFHN